MMAAGTAHRRAREHSTVTRSDQAELRRDARRKASGHKILSHRRPERRRLSPPMSNHIYVVRFQSQMDVRRGLRDWLLAKDPDPSVRLRVLRDILDRPTDEPAVAREQKEVGRRGWAAQILNGQHPQGHWVNPGNSARELYRPKYVATNWRLLVLSDLGLTKKNSRVARAVGLFIRRFSRTGDLGGDRSEVCFTGNAVRMLARFGYLRDPHLKPSIDWLVRPQKKDCGWDFVCSRTWTAQCWGGLAWVSVPPTASRTPGIVWAIERGAE